MKYASVNGVRVFAPKSRNELIDHAMEQKSILIAVNAEKIMYATEESRNVINRNMGYPDGVGAVWALKKKGIPEVLKIPGCELWLDIIHKHLEDKSFYLVGGKEDVIQATVFKLKTEFPTIQLLNYRNGYIKSNEERKRLIQDVAYKKPDVVFVAIGSPKQELLMEEMHGIHPALYQGLGGSFDVYTGNVKRAPKWWVKNNLEWAYRLVNQPSRIKRQIHLVKFLVMLKLNRL
jgi:UDP-N-acetyl-D-mannosaminouronate:lipid I N-acetyl-D-mannosaminouronosyltransferase